MSVLVDRSLHQLSGPVRSCQIPRDGGHAVQAVKVVGRPRSGDDVSPFGQQRPGNGEPDALVGAGDDCDLVSELEIHDGYAGTSARSRRCSLNHCTAAGAATSKPST